jgi:hypothetical protein
VEKSEREGENPGQRGSAQEVPIFALIFPFEILADVWYGTWSPIESKT